MGDDRRGFRTAIIIFAIVEAIVLGAVVLLLLFRRHT
jgi:F0F1-type ATP synthase membrane subunit c/vacuolar-type H+-ATPase subunit K